jgi:hypothetical protein
VRRSAVARDPSRSLPRGARAHDVTRFLARDFVNVVLCLPTAKARFSHLYAGAIVLTACRPASESTAPCPCRAPAPLSLGAEERHRAGRDPRDRHDPLIRVARPGRPATSAPSRWLLRGQLDESGRSPPLREVERAYVERVVMHAHGNKSRAARLLQISFPTIANKLSDLSRAASRERQTTCRRSAATRSQRHEQAPATLASVVDVDFDLDRACVPRAHQDFCDSLRGRTPR